MRIAHLPTATEWGHDAGAITPEEIVVAVKEQTRDALRACNAWPEGPELCCDKDGYRRVSIVLPLTLTLFDQLMNGATGYRAHYAAGIEFGEAFNRTLVEAVASIVISYENLYPQKCDRAFYEKSLFGPFSKFWFTKELTDPSSQSALVKCREKLRVPRWVDYWRSQPKPRKGLLAPQPESPGVLLNGTFVNDAGCVYEQKPGRSQQLADRGWT